MGSTYDLEERTEKFARDVRRFVRSVKVDVANAEDCKQLVRSSGSVAANYIEANEALSKRDFIYRIKICRKESKESRMWLRLIEVFGNNAQSQIKQKLAEESSQLLKIFSKIAQS